MNSDIRLNVSFLQHPKTVKLRKRLGDCSVLSLLALWCFTAQNRPDGVLLGMDSEDVEIASQWNGQSGLFINTLIELTLLDYNEGVFVVHDWQENNPWAADFENRSLRAKQAVTTRWEREKERKAKIVVDTPSIRPVYDPNTKCNTPFLSLPFPTIPSLSKKHLSEYSDDFTLFWKMYPNRTGKGAAWKSWQKNKPPIDKVLESLQWQVSSRQWKEGFIPLPATYLNQRRWEDELSLQEIPDCQKSKDQLRQENNIAVLKRLEERMTNAQQSEPTDIQRGNGKATIDISNNHNGTASRSVLSCMLPLDRFSV